MYRMTNDQKKYCCLFNILYFCVSPSWFTSHWEKWALHNNPAWHSIDILNNENVMCFLARYFYLVQSSQSDHQQLINLLISAGISMLSSMTAQFLTILLVKMTSADCWLWVVGMLWQDTVLPSPGIQNIFIASTRR